ERSKSPVWRPLSDLLWVEGLVIAAWLLLGIGIGLVHDTIMQNVLSMIAWRSVVVVCGVALLIMALTIAASKWLKLAQGAGFQRVGGAALGGVFAAVVLFYGAKLFSEASSVYSSVDSAENALLTALVEQHRVGRDAANLAASNAALEVTAS